MTYSPQVTINDFIPTTPALHQVSSFGSMFLASHLHIATSPDGYSDGDRLVIGDGLRSVFVLSVDPESGEIESDQRDMATHRVMRLAGVRDGGESVIIADVSCCSTGFSAVLIRLGPLEPLDVQAEGADRNSCKLRFARGRRPLQTG